MINRQLLDPQNIVIVGGSNDIHKPGGKILKNLLDGRLKLKKIETRTWAKAIENSFQKNPEVCPDCLKYMIKDTVYL